MSAEKNRMIGSVEEGLRSSIRTACLLSTSTPVAVCLSATNYSCLVSLHKVLLAKNKLNETEHQFFLFGGNLFDPSTQLPNPDHTWITAPMWDNIR